MRITIGYKDRDYGGHTWRPGEYNWSIRIVKEDEATAIRPQDAPFPHEKDRVYLYYKWDPVPRPHWYDAEGRVHDAGIQMYFEEAEELAHQLLKMVQQAKLDKAPVGISRP
jgi:hypothetical protein